MKILKFVRCMPRKIRVIDKRPRNPHLSGVKWVYMDIAVEGVKSYTPVS